MDNSIFYNYNRIRSYNALFNFIISNRGGGKTYGAKKMCINNFLKRKEQFVYVRRYKSEIKEVRDNFFSDISQEFQGHELTVNGSKIYIDGEIAGYFIPLSVSQKYKSTAYPFVTTIVYDEFIIDKGHISYLSNEVEVFLDLFETIARKRDNVKAFFLANNVTLVNPYFTYFDCVPKKDQRFTLAKNGNIIVEMFTDEEFIKEKEKTRFGQLISGTKYGDYAINNKSLRDSKAFILDKKPKDLYFILSIYFNGEERGIYCSNSEGIYYCCKDFMETSKNRFTIQTNDHDLNFIRIMQLRSFPIFQHIIRMFNVGKLTFDSIETKTFFFEVFKTIGIK